MEEVVVTRKRGRPSNDNNNNDIIEKKESKSNSKLKGSKSSKVNYNIGDKVMALDKTNGAIYEAKILKVHYVGKQYKYFIHFQKWNPKYDTWTDDTNLAPIDDKEAIAILQASARVIIVADDKKGKKNKVKVIEKTDEAIAAVSTSSSTPIVNRGIVINETGLKKARKQLAESDQIDFDDTPDDPCTITIDIPINLKEHLVDEHGLICNEPKHLILLPRCNNVASIIQDFLAFKESKFVGDPDGFLVYKELFEGLCLLFDKSLPLILLYRHERNQFDVISEKIKEKDLK
jgi:mortality factor 4-like protein 1